MKADQQPAELSSSHYSASARLKHPVLLKGQRGS